MQSIFFNFVFFLTLNYLSYQNEKKARIRMRTDENVRTRILFELFVKI